MTPRFGPPPRPAIRYRRRPGAYAVLLRKGRVLLTYQAWPEAEHQLPGGGIDPGEHPIAALHREVYEETGWRISAPVFIGNYRRFCFMPDYDFFAEKQCSIWLARPIARLGPPSEPGHSAVWVKPAEALQMLRDPGSRAMLEHALRRG